MGKIEWTPALSVGVEIIDQEHQKLISLCNKLISNVKGDKDASMITESFKELRAYTVYHFDNEESYQKKISFPEANAHAQEHAKLKQDVKAFQQSLYREGFISEESVIAFLKKWLINHVLYQDMKMKTFLKLQE
ncbi:bacteriohemerythrin [Solidesulfovibrio magneticus]|uniref:Hemerythrin family protein n=1 Tax=Solidesulfovibrio magneticus (strain ATCC 700980 / DSM 13731 / RS-1) TaxID=573370 RepID=C4XM34_SOLM1|nr:bacteriohemerythrin [Solidesulfovibrio magneticus]BAH77162.1 hemerythrin family protein [Solidesulfovibrio magneticus RS-1]